VTGGCKHISALVLFVNNDSAQSKTSHENAWRGAVASTKNASSAKYKKGKRIADMYPPVTRKNVYQALELPPRQSIPNSALQIILRAQEHSVENENVSDDRLYTLIIFMTTLYQGPAILYKMSSICNFFFVCAAFLFCF
jgi:hypothetical protein